MTKKRVFPSLPPLMFYVTRTLTEPLSALSSLVPFSAQNASWRNSPVSFKKAGGPVTKRIHPASSFDYVYMHIVYQEIIASLCLHSSSSSPFRPFSHLALQASPIGQTGSKQSKSDWQTTEPRSLWIQNTVNDAPVTTIMLKVCL